MNELRHELYSTASLAKLEKTMRLWQWARNILCVGSVGILVLLCVNTHTGNAAQMELAATITAVLGGWAVLAVQLYAIGEYRREIEHERHMLEEEKEEAVSGPFEVCGKPFHVPGSIDIIDLETVSGAAKRRVHLNLREKKQLPRISRAARVFISHGYIKAWEASDAPV